MIWPLVGDNFYHFALPPLYFLIPSSCFISLPSHLSSSLLISLLSHLSSSQLISLPSHLSSSQLILSPSHLFSSLLFFFILLPPSFLTCSSQCPGLQQWPGSETGRLWQCDTCGGHSHYGSSQAKRLHSILCST